MTVLTKVNATGRETGKLKVAKPYKLKHQFVPLNPDMLNSPARRVLTQAARMILDRLEVEHCNHAGKENGKLKCTFSDFIEYGVHRSAVAPAIRELEKLGFIRVSRGPAGNGEHRAPSVYRLTYLHAEIVGEPASNEWRRIPDEATARALASAARNQKAERNPRHRLRRAAE